MKTTKLSIISSFRFDDNKVVGSSSAESGDSVGGSDASRKSGKSKNQTKSGQLSNTNIMEEPKFLISEVRETFNYLRQAFTKALILWHFDLKCHIQIKIDELGYTIRKVLSQLASNQLTLNNSIFFKLNIDCHLVIYFSKKIISTKTRYKIYNNELLAIVETIKTWRHYLEGYKYKVFIFTNHINLCQFIDTKSLISCQVW